MENNIILMMFTCRYFPPGYVLEILTYPRYKSQQNPAVNRTDKDFHKSVRLVPDKNYYAIFGCRPNGHWTGFTKSPLANRQKNKKTNSCETSSPVVNIDVDPIGFNMHHEYRGPGWK
jgi:hypothetical protein